MAIDPDVAPPKDMRSVEYEWWRKGATAESRLAQEGLTRDQRELLGYLRENAQHRGGPPIDLLADGVVVFTANMTFIQRLRYVWALSQRVLRR